MWCEIVSKQQNQVVKYCFVYILHSLCFVLYAIDNWTCNGQAVILPNTYLIVCFVVFCFEAKVWNILLSPNLHVKAELVVNFFTDQELSSSLYMHNEHRLSRNKDVFFKIILFITTSVYFYFNIFLKLTRKC